MGIGRRSVAAVVGSMLLVANAQATVLTFSPFASVETIPQTYGDRVTVFGADYGSAGGETPNVVVNYVPTDGSGFPFTNWVGGYGTLQNALGHQSFSVKGYVELVPDAGYDVVLTSFQVGSWGGSSYADSSILVTTAAGAALYDSGVFTFPGSTVFSYPNAPIRSSGPLRIVINDYGDLGLDNVTFSQAATIPEPESYAMMLAGLGLIGWWARRRAGQSRRKVA